MTESVSQHGNEGEAPDGIGLVIESALHPAGYAVLFVAFCLLVAALISVTRQDAGAAGRIGWVLIVLLVPIVGPMAWFAVGRRRRRGQPQV